MLQKTTVYLDSLEMKRLESRAAPNQVSVASLIRKAVQVFLNTRSESGKFIFLKKHLLKKNSKSSFKDPVSYQKNLRREWL